MKSKRGKYTNLSLPTYFFYILLLSALLVLCTSFVSGKWKYGIMVYCCTCLSNSLFSGIMLGVWNWPWWEYIYHGNQQMLQIRLWPPCHSPGISCLASTNSPLFLLHVPRVSIPTICQPGTCQTVSQLLISCFPQLDCESLSDNSNIWYLCSKRRTKHIIDIRQLLTEW